MHSKFNLFTCKGLSRVQLRKSIKSDKTLTFLKTCSILAFHPVLHKIWRIDASLRLVWPKLIHHRSNNWWPLGCGLLWRIEVRNIFFLTPLFFFHNFSKKRKKKIADVFLNSIIGSALLPQMMSSRPKSICRLEHRISIKVSNKLICSKEKSK